MTTELGPIQGTSPTDELQASTPRSNFLGSLAGMEQESIEAIMFHYDFAEKAHEGQYRASGEPYFMHPYETAMILLNLGIRKPAVIGAALTHDVAEDTDSFRRDIPDRIPYFHWLQLMNKRMVERGFPNSVANINITLSKPRVHDTINGIEIRDSNDRREAYAEVLEHFASDDALLVKMADRLHNLRTLTALSPEKRAKVIKETQEVYIPIFERRFRDTSYEYRDEADSLLGLIKNAIDDAQATL